MAVAPVAVDRGGEHEPLGLQLLRQALPDLLQQQLAALLRAQPAGLRLPGRLCAWFGADAAFEVAVQAGSTLLKQAGFNHLPADQRLA